MEERARGRSVLLARLALAGVAVVAASLVALHLVGVRFVSGYPAGAGYDPRRNFLSEYVLTDHAALMRIVFCALTAVALLLAQALRKRRLKRVALCLLLAGVGTTILGLCRTDPAWAVQEGIWKRTPPFAGTWIGFVHDQCSLLVFIPLLMAAAGVGPDVSRETWSWPRVGAAFAVAALSLATGCLVQSALTGGGAGEAPSGWTGLTQRVVVVPTLSWLGWLAARLSRR